MDGIENNHYGQDIMINRKLRVTSIIGDVYTDFKNFITNPSLHTFIAAFTDFSSYFLMPMEGGYQACQSHVMFIQD